MFEDMALFRVGVNLPEAMESLLIPSALMRLLLLASLLALSGCEALGRYDFLACCPVLHLQRRSDYAGQNMVHKKAGNAFYQMF